MDDQNTESVEETSGLEGPTLGDVFYGKTEDIAPEIESAETEEEASISPADGTTESEEEEETAIDDDAELEASEEEVSANDEDTVEVYLIDDKEYTLDDLRGKIKSDLLEKGFTQKTQKLAKTQKDVETKSADFDGKLSTLNNQIDAMAQILNEDSEAIDWDDLRRHDPSEYLIKQEEQKNKVDRLQKVMEQRNEIFEKQQAEFQAVNLEKFSELLPEWQDKAAQKSDLVEIGAMTKSLGYDDAEINNVQDARLWAIFRDAAKFRSLQNKSTETKKKVIKAKKSSKKIAKQAQKSAPKSAADVLYG